MNWLNIRTETLRTPEFIGSDPVERATWLCVIGYCCEQENGGLIVGARHWKDRQWQQTCGVSLKEITKSQNLFSWDGDDLEVWNYPKDKECEIRGKREVARINGQRGGRPATNQEPTLEPTSVNSVNQRPKAEWKGMEVEGEGKENGNGKELAKPKASGVASESGLEFADWFRTTLPTTTRLSPNWRNQWAGCYDDMIRLDERPPNQILHVCRWARMDSFWSSQFQSPMKLRDRKDGIMYFDTFAARMKNGHGQKSLGLRENITPHIIEP